MRFNRFWVWWVWDCLGDRVVVTRAFGSTVSPHVFAQAVQRQFCPETCIMIILLPQACSSHGSSHGNSKTNGAGTSNIGIRGGSCMKEEIAEHNGNTTKQSSTSFS